jgi:hypothetical protein
MSTTTRIACDLLNGWEFMRPFLTEFIYLQQRNHLDKRIPAFLAWSSTKSLEPHPAYMHNQSYSHILKCLQTSEICKRVLQPVFVDSTPHQNLEWNFMWKDNIYTLMEVSVMMVPKTSKSQVVADFCCGWGNCHIYVIGHYAFEFRH